MMGEYLEGCRCEWESDQTNIEYFYILYIKIDRYGGTENIIEKWGQ